MTVAIGNSLWRCGAAQQPSASRGKSWRRTLSPEEAAFTERQAFRSASGTRVQAGHDQEIGGLSRLRRSVRGFPRGRSPSKTFTDAGRTFGIRSTNCEIVSGLGVQRQGRCGGAVVPHNGMDCSDRSSPAASRDPNVILGGHTHDAFPQPIAHHAGAHALVTRRLERNILRLTPTCYRTRHVKGQRRALTAGFLCARIADTESRSGAESRMREAAMRQATPRIATAYRLLYIARPIFLWQPWIS